MIRLHISPLPPPTHHLPIKILHLVVAMIYLHNAVIILLLPITANSVISIISINLFIIIILPRKKTPFSNKRRIEIDSSDDSSIYSDLSSNSSSSDSESSHSTKGNLSASFPMDTYNSSLSDQDTATRDPRLDKGLLPWHDSVSSGVSL